jgi:hypothetical protein
LTYRAAAITAAGHRVGIAITGITITTAAVTTITKFSND